MMLRQGKGSPLVLFHGILGSAAMWRYVVPLVAEHHDTVAPTVLGHRGGRGPGSRPVRMVDLVDDAERILDELGVSRAHLAGNSLGGWVALELARRGRALSVCALSPAGCWDPAVAHRTGPLRATIRATRLGRGFLPWLARSAAARRWVMRRNAVHGERLAPAELTEMADDLLGCTIAADLLGTSEALATLDPVPCPVTIAWSERDRVFPLGEYGPRARERVPDARFILLPGVGHVPMIDAPELVAQTLLESTGCGVRGGVEERAAS